MLKSVKFWVILASVFVCLILRVSMPQLGKAQATRVVCALRADLRQTKACKASLHGLPLPRLVKARKCPVCK